MAPARVISRPKYWNIWRIIGYASPTSARASSRKGAKRWARARKRLNCLKRQALQTIADQRGSLFPVFAGFLLPFVWIAPFAIQEQLAGLKNQRRIICRGRVGKVEVVNHVPVSPQMGVDLCAPFIPPQPHCSPLRSRGRSLDIAGHDIFFSRTFLRRLLDHVFLFGSLSGLFPEK